MHFQHPELLYALFLLIIPIIVHLFRLRKFQKEDFTNVKFLKKVIQETRKSSRLKKFLVLISRLLIFTCLILAFSKPYIPASETALKDSATLIYLDNSFSMQAPEGSASIFQTSVNQLLEQDLNSNYGLITNESDYFSEREVDIKNNLIDMGYSATSPDFRNIQIRSSNFFRKYPNTEKNLVIISDFQENLSLPDSIFESNYQLHLVPKRTADFVNISIDTAFIASSNPENFNLNIKLSSNTEESEPVAVSVFNGEKLLGRNTVKIDDKAGEISFTLQNEIIENGKIEIEDAGLKYDNYLFFNIQENQSIEVVIISEEEEDFLNRIYTEPEFKISRFAPSQIDFNQLNSANLIIANEIETVPNSLITNLQNASKNGTSLIIIPSEGGGNYNGLLNSLGFNNLGSKILEERLITSIEFDHPLLEGVFEDRTDNFEYPKAITSFNLDNGRPILSYQDNQPFLLENNSVFVFTSSLNTSNSNFTNSPLVVPIFYQIGLKSLKTNQLYYQTNISNLIDIPVQLSKDEVLHLENAETDLIPQQKNFSNRVEISTENIDLNAGNFSIKTDNTTISTISFNYNRKESNLEYIPLSEVERNNAYDSINDYFSEINAASQINALWKWFVIFALIFLAIEMLLIKFLK